MQYLTYLETNGTSVFDMEGHTHSGEAGGSEPTETPSTNETTTTTPEVADPADYRQLGTAMLKQWQNYYNFLSSSPADRTVFVHSLGPFFQYIADNAADTDKEDLAIQVQKFTYEDTTLFNETQEINGVFYYYWEQYTQSSSYYPISIPQIDLSRDAGQQAYFSWPSDFAEY